jgi:hypothetical protein
MGITVMHRSRRLFTTAAAVTLGLAGSALAATPAHALTGLSLVVATSDPSSATKAVTAECPNGDKVFGSGAKIIDGLGDVHITNMYPNAELTKVFARGAETNGIATDWQVVAYAICGPEGGHALQRVEVAAPGNGTSDPANRQFGVNCPDDTKLFGTGFRTENASGDVFVQDAYPESSLTEAYYDAAEHGSTTANWSFYGYAICGDPDGADMQVVSTFPAADFDDEHSTESPDCPAGWAVTGLGGTVQGTTSGDILIDRISVNPTLTRVTSTGRENTPYSQVWNEAAFAVCVSQI